MGKKYRSDAMAAVHETMEALHRVGAINKQTMRKFDEACLTPVQPLSPKQIKALREREHVSQTVFANYLNVTPNLVSKWERGEKRPSGPATQAPLSRRKKRDRGGRLILLACRGTAGYPLSDNRSQVQHPLA